MMRLPWADAYRATLASFAGAVKAIRELQYYGGEFGGNYAVEGECGNTVQRSVREAFCKVIDDGFCSSMEKEKFERGYRNSYNRFASCVRKAAWSTVFAKTEMSRFMTKGVQEEFEKLQHDQQHVEFTEENVTRMLEMLLLNGDRIREATIMEAFDLMTKYHKENRIHWEGWKTNDYWRVNRRFILPHILDRLIPGLLRLNYYHGKELCDIDRGLCLLEGCRFDNIQTTSDVIEDALLRKVPAGTKLYSHFFEIRYYKKGTGHFMFLDEAVWERFNVAACKGKKWLPADAA